MSKEEQIADEVAVIYNNARLLEWDLVPALQQEGLMREICDILKDKHDISMSMGYGNKLRALGDTLDEVAPHVAPAPIDRVRALNVTTAIIVMHQSDWEYWLEYAETHSQRQLEAAIRAQDALPPPEKQDAFIIHGDYRDHTPCDIDLLLTDPPYMTEINDIYKFVNEWIPFVLDHLKDSGQAYIFTGAYFQEIQTYIEILAQQGRFSKQILLWEYKNTLGPRPKGKYKQTHQMLFYLRGPNAPEINTDTLTELVTVQNFAMERPSVHKWQKPYDLATMLIRHGSKEGDLIYDPFAGTGTFLLAAAEYNRKNIGVEINEEIIDLAYRRGCKKK